MQIKKKQNESTPELDISGHRLETIKISLQSLRGSENVLLYIVNMREVGQYPSNRTPCLDS